MKYLVKQEEYLLQDIIGNTNVIEYITIATRGNSQDFGDTEASGAGSTMAGTQKFNKRYLGR